MCLCNIATTASWEDCKLILQENFSNLQMKQHISSYLTARAQQPGETLQEYIYLVPELMKILTGLEPL